MVAYTFKSRFVVPIELGIKQQTIRKVRKRHAREGERIQLYTGDRFHPRKVGEADCRSVDGIWIDLADGGQVLIDPGDVAQPQIYINTPTHLDAFAILDGFRDWADLVAFWRQTHPGADTFAGIRIFWGDSFKGGVALQPPAGENE